MSTQYFVVGKIVNTQGIKGEVRVVSRTDFPENRYQIGNQLYIEKNHQHIPVTITAARQQKGFEILRFKEYPDINAVLPLMGYELVIAAEDRPDFELAKGQYYYHQIIGLQIIDANSGENYGSVTSIMSPGANDVWVIDSPKYGEILLPYIQTVVKKIDLENGKAFVDIPGGLIDEN